MPSPSKIDQLPEDVRAELDRRLIEGGFGGCVALSEWLKEQGYEISKSTVGERNLKLKRKLAAIKASTEAARMIAEAAPDDADDRSNAIISMVQTEMLESLLTMQDAAEENDPAKRVAILGKAAKNIATLTRASVARNKWAMEVRNRLASELAAMAKEGFDQGTLAEAEKRISIYLPANNR